MGSLLFLGLGQPKPLNSKVLPDQRAIKGFPSSESCVSNRINPELKDTTIYNLGHSLALKFASTNDPFLYKPELENDKETCNYSQMGSFVQDNRGEGTFERILWICLWANDGIKEKMVFFFSLSLSWSIWQGWGLFLFITKECPMSSHCMCVCRGAGVALCISTCISTCSVQTLLWSLLGQCVSGTYKVAGGKRLLKHGFPAPNCSQGKEGDGEEGRGGGKEAAGGRREEHNSRSLCAWPPNLLRPMKCSFQPTSFSLHL